MAHELSDKQNPAINDVHIVDIYTVTATQTTLIARCIERIDWFMHDMVL